MMLLPKSDEPTNLDLESVQGTDFIEDYAGKALGVLLVEWKAFSSKQLRSICSCLSVKGVKNAKKSKMVDMLVGF